ncbi:MAG: ATP-dependent RNA helicase HrpA [Pseudonocardiaceae bacterium]|nr:ATP-dependent RNA helicase HrpA [Pseudonocardiaceae bacterium]
MGTSFSRSPLADLRDRLPGLMLRDQRRLGRRLDGARKVRDPQRRQAIADEIGSDIDDAQQRIDGRRAVVPNISYPEALPISRRRDEIAAAIRDHQVVVVAGETGSGKTTQLPKICLQLGRGVQGLIGHTQPRRIAARTVAERISEELDTPLGGAVGYTVRFTDQVGDGSLVKLMTDGILLTEIQRDRLLRQYDTLIIDEAHERSLNVDFLIGYLKQLLPRRPDLKVIITSATIDPERFSRHFDGAPVVEVSGRTYPVQVRYRPVVDPDDPDGDDRDQTQAICDAVGELRGEGLRGEGLGDILVFLSGEREIRDTRDALAALDLPDTEILPLFARLSAAEQHRVFAPHRGRRIVLATNVAETSLTVPGIKYVIDPGTARISRYSHRLKVQRLPIERVSQASARQRAGRCGRTSDGICIRLYTEADFADRPEFTDPEILRTNLASVILQMTSLGLGDIGGFPFVDPPDRRAISDGVVLLDELGALDPAQQDPHKRLTRLGRDLAQLPVDPRLGRMVLEADRNGCLREVMIIVAALSIQDPRERPAEARQAADDTHARFAEKDSDFLAYLHLWQYLSEQQKALSSNRFRKLCKAEFLHYQRIREWQDLYGQLRQVSSGLGLSRNSTPADPQRVHVCLLAGLLSHVGLRDVERRDYLGARGARFAVFPGSSLFGKPPRWVMAAELVETSRLWGRICARIEPEWIEPLAGHLVKRSYSEPHWERNRGSAVAYERVTLYGVPIVAARLVNYGRIDPEVSRELFIRHALVEGDWETRHAFFRENRALLDEVAELENRARRRDILVDDDTLFDFYDRRVPADVVSARHFDSWWRTARRTQPDLLDFSTEMLVNEAAGVVAERDYPDVWRHGSLALPLTYQFEPGADADGVTVHIPLPVLNQVGGDDFSWQVPGLRQELVTALLRSLPKPLRRNVVPVPDVATAVLARVTPYGEPLLDALERELRELGAAAVPRDAWQLDRVPEHLKPTFRVTDGQDGTVAEGKDLDDLQRRCAPALSVTLSEAAAGLEREGLRSWEIGTLPNTHRQQRDGHVVTAYPALVDEGDAAAVRMFASPEAARQAMWQGTRRLLLLDVPSPVKQVARSLGNEAKLTLARNPHGSVAALLDDCVHCAADKIITDCGGPARVEDGYGRLRDAVRAELGATVLDVVGRVQRVLAAAHAAEARLATTSGSADALADIRTQLAALVGDGFVTATGWERLQDLPRYLQAIERRLEKLPRDPGRDRDLMRDVEAVTREYEQLTGTAPAEALTPIRWMIEELRVSYFAQELRTAYPVSVKRIHRAIDEVAETAAAR